MLNIQTLRWFRKSDHRKTANTRAKTPHPALPCSEPEFTYVPWSVIQVGQGFMNHSPKAQETNIT